MKLYIVENGKLIEYERTGRCNGCGECCGEKNTITYTVTVGCGSQCRGSEGVESVPGRDAWEVWEGYTVLWSQGLWWYFKVIDVSEKVPQIACEEQDPETKMCSAWKTEDWPAICRYWPFKPSDLESFPKCGFSFRRVPEAEAEEEEVSDEVG